MQRAVPIAGNDPRIAMKLSALSTTLVLTAAVAFDASPSFARPVHASGMNACMPRDGNVVQAKDCGATGNGATSDRDALQRCVSAAATSSGGVCLLEAGTFVVDSVNDKAISIPNDVTLKGQGSEATMIKVSGAGQLNQVLTFDNPSNDWVEALTLRGNSVNGCAGCGGLVAFVGTEGATRPMAAFGLKKVSVENDRHDYWVYVLNNSAQPMRGITIDHLRARSFPDNCRDQNSIGVPCDVLSFRGQAKDPGGTIVGVTITAPVADGSYIKRFADFWDGVSDVHVTGGRLENFGAHAGNDAAAYALTAYFMDLLKGRGSPPSHIWITNNTIANPRTAGVYTAIVRDIHVDNNRISGQYDPTDQTLPHGAVALGNTSGEVTGNKLTGNLYGIEAAPGGPIQDPLTLVRNTIASEAADGKGIAISGMPRATDVTLKDNLVSMGGARSFALMLTGSAAAPLGHLSVTGGALGARFANVFFYDKAGGQPAAGSIRLDGVTLSGRPTNSGFGAANCGSAPITLSNVVIEAAAFDGANGISVENCSNVTLEGVVVRKLQGRGRALVLDGATVRASGTQFVNVAPENR
jgi:hypothetical protein